MNDAISDRLRDFGQEHILDYLHQMTGAERQALLEDVAGLDLRLIAELYGFYRQSRGEEKQSKAFDAADVLRLPATAAGARERARLSAIGEDMLRQGRVAVFLVAGGQGTRLGYHGPKGCFQISPVRHKSLFQLFAESILALRRRYGAGLPWYVMTSRDNNGATCAFFEEHRYFGLDPDSVRFIIQKENPSLDRDGRLIVSPEKKIFKNPNGHGGALAALKDSGALKEMADQGIDEIFYFQVDNPLVKIADPLFIGAHAENRAEMSTKVVQKTDPAEKVGIIGRVNGRLGCIEYSELSPAEIQERLPDGRLRFSSANIAVHLLGRGFVEKLTGNPAFRLPFHIAVKNIDCLGPDGVQKTIQGVKFETFIFDALGFAERSVTLEVPRQEEFAPVKNAEGPDSPETARAALAALHRGWLAEAGRVRTAVPEDLIVEISPLYALDGKAFAVKYTPPSALTSPLYIE